MNKTITLKSNQLEGYFTQTDHSNIVQLHSWYNQALESFHKLDSLGSNSSRASKETQKLITLYDKMGKFMQEITAQQDNLHVYCFKTPSPQHGEASRLIAKLRAATTGHDEFVYYIQRAYELLFNLTWGSGQNNSRNHLVVQTPVSIPTPNFAVHKIPNVDSQIADTVMCIMLRGALLPSLIVSKEIQEYSSTGYVTPFALFHIQRDDTKNRNNMEYILNLDKSFFNPEALDGKNLVFADPMNATGGSLVTVINYLESQGIKPQSVKALNVVSALQGALQIVRSLSNVDVYTLWMDPILNDKAYILPGLGDAGDRINGPDSDSPRNIIQLVADYGSTLASLYRSQVREIERTVLQE